MPKAKSKNKIKRRRITFSYDASDAKEVSLMGGFNVWARKNHVKIIRNEGEGTAEYVFNYGAFAAGKAPDSNILLRPGDTVVVPE